MQSGHFEKLFAANAATEQTKGKNDSQSIFAEFVRRS
jgi:hypothetical protein